MRIRKKITILISIKTLLLKHKKKIERNPRFDALVQASKTSSELSKRYSESMNSPEKREAKRREMYRKLEDIRYAAALTEQRIESNPRVLK